MSDSVRIYAAHPMTIYGTPRETRALARIATLAPEAEIIDPATQYANNEQWQADWPKLLPNLDAFIVFGDRGGVPSAPDACTSWPTPGGAGSLSPCLTTMGHAVMWTAFACSPQKSGPAGGQGSWCRDHDSLRNLS